MSMFGFLRQKRAVVDDPAVAETRRRQDARRHEMQEKLCQERGELRNGIQVIQAHSRRLSAMANAMALARENSSG